MTDRKYKPRLGFDIRVKPPARTRKKPPAWSDPGERDCEMEGCNEKAACSLPLSPREPEKRVWYCLHHAREHNRKWNYFEGLSEQEARAARSAQAYGERPTWSMGKNARAKASASMPPSGGPGSTQETRKKDSTHISVPCRNGRPLTRLHVKAFETLALPYTASAEEIRRRYAELVRRFHPDSNDGDRGAEEQLNETVKAHAILKKARFL